MGTQVLQVLAELEHALRSNAKEKITSEELEFLRNAKEKLVDTFYAGSFLSGIVAFAAARRFNTAPRIACSAKILTKKMDGVAFLGGLWSCKLALRTFLDPILASDGSRMQKELANIMLSKNQEESFRSSFISKYLHGLLYPEKVFVDSDPDKVFLRWRLRNSYEDTSNDISSIERPREEPIQPFIRRPVNLNRYVRENNDVVADPLDCIFGLTDTRDVTQFQTNVLRSRRAARAHKRANRRVRSRNRNVVEISDQE